MLCHHKQKKSSFLMDILIHQLRVHFFRNKQYLIDNLFEERFLLRISLLHQIILLTYTQKYWQYPGGNALSYSSGTIKISKNNKLIYDASTKSGSSGSPIFIKDTTEFIGIHRGGFNDIKINIGNFN